MIEKNMIDISSIKRALVVGLGYRTGVAVCNFLAGKGVAVTVSDSKSPEALANVSDKLPASVRLVAGPQDPAILDAGFDLLVLSPGVPKSIPLVREAERRGVPVISEIELAYYSVPGMFVGITGTDGKTTTTSLTGHILRALGIDTLVGGNIGTPLISFAGKSSADTAVVAELSSFQLETVREFRPAVAAILNVTPDHLDRDRDMNEYLEAKLRIAMNQKADDFFIANRDDGLVWKSAAGLAPEVRSFSLNDAGADMNLSGSTLWLRRGGTPVKVASTGKMQITGLHNAQNAMAATLMVISVCERMGIEPDLAVIEASLYSFKGLEHRMERIGTFMGRNFINDSKATTVGAVEMAVRGFKGDCVLILGGRTKGDDYSRLAAGIRGRVRGLVLIGESREEFSRIFSDFIQIKADTLEDAVVKGIGMSSEGDTILLSPACASFDMFESYEERGDLFRRTVGRLISGEEKWT